MRFLAEFCKHLSSELLDTLQEQLVKITLWKYKQDWIFTDQVITYNISLDSIQYAPNHESLDFFRVLQLSKLGMDVHSYVL